MNESAKRSARSGTTPLCGVILGVWGLVACREDARFGSNPSAMPEGGSPAGGSVATAGIGGTTHQAGGTPHQASSGAGGLPSHAGSGGVLETAGAAGTEQVVAGAGGVGSDGDGVKLTALYLPGSGVVRAKWQNGTDSAIFLPGCSTVDGWYREGDEWKKYGSFAACATEGPGVEVAAGATYGDPAAGIPPDRGDNVWRLVGSYGTACTPGVEFSAANCAEVHEVTSVNEVTVN